MPDKNDPKNEGHTREWQDRARVVLDAKRDAGTEADPNQSPSDVDNVKRQEKDENTSRDEEQKTDDSVY